MKRRWIAYWLVEIASNPETGDVEPERCRYLQCERPSLQAALRTASDNDLFEEGMAYLEEFQHGYWQPIEKYDHTGARVDL